MIQYSNNMFLKLHYLGNWMISNLNCHKPLWHILWASVAFFVLTWESDTSGNSFRSVMFINYFPLFQWWCMMAFTLVRLQKYLKLTLSLSSFKDDDKGFSWETTTCVVSCSWSPQVSRLDSWNVFIFHSLLTDYNAFQVIWILW